MSALLPHLLDPWSYGYHSLVKTLAPIDGILVRGVTPHNLGQTYNPTVSNPRSVSSPPIPSVAGGQSSVQVESASSNNGGKPPTQVVPLRIGLNLTEDLPYLCGWEEQPLQVFL